MVNISTVEARNEFSTLVNRVAFGKERVVLTRRGKELLAMIPLEDLKLLERLLKRLEDLEDLEDARLALAEAEHEGTISLGQLKHELNL
ncbi:MAG: type II toxin-antitoxin system Phd/YefM family antitoxin [bacterium]|nr:type II toxin-antitoxin system Phd/YefM family antitoxin [bacterium]